jgi:hypothetical protein
MSESQRLRDTKQELAETRAERDDGQGSLFGDDTDAAIESVGEHAGDHFMQSALEAVRAHARLNTTLTAWDCRHRCTNCTTYDARSWGKVMKVAAANGWIRSTGTYRPGPKETHSRPLLIWRSNITEATGHNYEWHSQPDSIKRFDGSIE